jgi:antitoxin CptB
VTGPESRDARLRRLRMRSWRRGIKEMDLILGGFCDARLDGLGDETLDLYDALLAENDQDLYRWVTGQAPAPERFSALIAEISGYLRAS